MAEELIEVLKPLKSVIILFSTNITATVSMILPFKTTILNLMQPGQDDSSTVKEDKSGSQRKPAGQILCLL